MSFFSNIGKAIGGIAKSLTGGEGIGGLLKKGLSSLVGGFAGKIMDMASSGPLANIANKVIGWAAQVGPQMAQSGGFMGMLGGLLSKVGGMGSLANIAESLIGKLGGAGAIPGGGIQNLTELFAQRQAQLMQP